MLSARTVNLTEHRQSGHITLNWNQLQTLLSTKHIHKIDVSPSLSKEDSYRLTPSSCVGALNANDLSIIVRPKIPIGHVMFLIMYAMDPKNWHKHEHRFNFADADILETIAPVFVHYVNQTIRRGLLKGYQEVQDSLYTVRGRVRFDDQIRRRPGMSLPVEVQFDEHTIDIDKNRLIGAAIDLLCHASIRSDNTKRMLYKLRAVFADVKLIHYIRGRLPKVSYTRLDEYYRPSVDLARYIIENTGIDLRHGKMAGFTFFVNMNYIFERFLYVALREALDIPYTQWCSGTPIALDDRGSIAGEPDLSWRPPGAGLPIFVGDAKYKEYEEGGYNADIYQALAYCTAADLPSCMLVYALGKPAEYRITHSGKTIQVITLDMTGDYESILEKISSLAEWIRLSAMGAGACRCNELPIPE